MDVCDNLYKHKANKKLINKQNLTHSQTRYNVQNSRYFIQNILTLELQKINRITVTHAAPEEDERTI